MDQLKTVRYITQDPLSNLKLRVHLTCLSRASKARQTVVPQQKPVVERDESTAADVGEHPVAGADTADADTSPAADRPGRLDLPDAEAHEWSRVFSWQEKVFSKAEVEAFKSGTTGAAGEPGSPSRRQVSIGPFSLPGGDTLASSASRHSVLFSYIHHDKAAEELERGRSLTTSATEPMNHLLQSMLHNPRTRDKVLNYQSMYIMADLATQRGGSQPPAQVPLVHLKAYPDGSFDMTPGFSRADTPSHRFEDGSGRMFEYRVENASVAAPSMMEGHIAGLARAVVARADDQQHRGGRPLFTPPPQGPPTALRLLVLAEIMAASGFQRDNLYVDFAVAYNPSLWSLQSAEGCSHEVASDDDDQDTATCAVVKGCTQISQMALYEEEPSLCRPATWVAHFAHPLELEWAADDAPATSQWPVMYFKVMTYDSWDRYTCEGYGWMPLATHCPGSGTHYVSTWQPLGSARDSVQSFFIGGSPELEDLSFLAYPRGWKGAPLDKYGFQTVTSGTLKVRINSMVQQQRPRARPQHRATLKPSGPSLARKDLSLAVVVERARSRLIESRSLSTALQQGSGSLTVAIAKDPCDATVSEGSLVELKVEAVGVPPLRYQWHKDSKALSTATADSPTLLIAATCVADNGSYFCRVSNASGTEDSARAQLVVRRAGRLGPQPALSTLAAEERPSTPPSRRASLLSSSLTQSSSPPLGRLRPLRAPHTPPRTPAGALERDSPRTPAAAAEALQHPLQHP